MRILVTGASGFVGSGVIRHLLAGSAYSVVAAYRKMLDAGLSGVEVHAGCHVAPETDWRSALEGVGAVVHLAARVHVMHDTARDPLAEFRRVNVEGSVQLAKQAAAAGVQRFVYVSSIKVNGESTPPGRPFAADDAPAPQDAYGRSKLEAERALREVSESTHMELVVVRPPLVYGPGVRANFRSMMTWLHRGVPLPLGAISNRRSLVALDNLCDLTVTCLRHPAAAGQTFLAADGEDVSTTELLRRLGRALNRPARLIAVPPATLRAMFSVLGKRDVGQRLCSSLQVDASKTRSVLQWTAPITLDEGLRRAAEGFLAERAACKRPLRT